MKTIAIIPAGGVGKRFNSPIPKQFLKVLGKEVIVYTLQIFQNSPSVDEIIVPVNNDYKELLTDIRKKYNITKLKKIVSGGKERQDSVFNGIKYSECGDGDLLIVHDAARPLLSSSLLETVIKEAKINGNVVLAIKARDTLLYAEEYVKNYIERNNAYYVQTPQIFNAGVLKKAFELAYKNNYTGTDESILVNKAGFQIKIVEGSFDNFKITTKSDLEIFEKLIK